LLVFAGFLPVFCRQLQTQSATSRRAPVGRQKSIGLRRTNLGQLSVEGGVI
jgi:hypothetical protein